MESTGRYHALLAHLASQAGLKVYVLNARDVHYYAKALGTRAKTDGVDAGSLPATWPSITTPAPLAAAHLGAAAPAGSAEAPCAGGHAPRRIDPDLHRRGYARP